MAKFDMGSSEYDNDIRGKRRDPNQFSTSEKPTKRIESAVPSLEEMMFAEFAEMANTSTNHVVV